MTCKGSVDELERNDSTDRPQAIVSHDKYNKFVPGLHKMSLDS